MHLTEREIAKEQRMINDENLSVPRATTSLVVKALVIGFAVAAHAVAIVAGNLVPYGRVRLVRKITQRTIGGFFGPRDDVAQLLDILLCLQNA